MPRIESSAEWPRCWNRRDYPLWFAAVGAVMSGALAIMFPMATGSVYGVGPFLCFGFMGVSTAMAARPLRSQSLSSRIRLARLNLETRKIDSAEGIVGIMIPDHPITRWRDICACLFLIMLGPAFVCMSQDVEWGEVPLFIRIGAWAGSAFGVVLFLVLSARGSAALHISEVGYFGVGRMLKWDEIESIEATSEYRRISDVNYIQLKNSVLIKDRSGNPSKWFRKPVAIKLNVSERDVDPALLLWELNRGLADPEYRVKFSTGEVLEEMRSSFPGSNPSTARGFR